MDTKIPYRLELTWYEFIDSELRGFPTENSERKAGGEVIGIRTTFTAI
jgi:hypothetical protein